MLCSALSHTLQLLSCCIDTLISVIVMISQTPQKLTLGKDDHIYCSVFFVMFLDLALIMT